ncbi:MAG TPA: hypothetical protein VIL78_17100 [Hanamia sp.]
MNCKIKNGELRICILPLASWLREAILSFASQIVFYHEDTQRKKAAQRKYKGIKV